MENISLKTLVSDELPETLIGDAFYLGSCVTNFVSNAIKFSKPNGTITVEVKPVISDVTSTTTTSCMLSTANTKCIATTINTKLDVILHSSVAATDSSVAITVDDMDEGYDNGCSTVAPTKKRNRLQMVRVSVTDEGVGIPEEHQHLIFKAFKQVPKTEEVSVFTNNLYKDVYTS